MRNKRFLEPHARYHVTARANRQEMILEADAFKERFLEVIRRAKTKYRFTILNFCIMGNHIHLIIQPFCAKPAKGKPDQSAPEVKSSENLPQIASLSKIMQWVLSVFARQYNKTRGIIGHVWYDRFHSTILTDYSHYLRTFIYVMRNPVRAKIVHEPTEYPYNGITFLRKGMMDIFEPG